MTLLLTAHSISKTYGTQILFKEIFFTISSGDRIGLIGPNGAGKSSLIKILAGEEEPDAGHLSKRQGLRVGYATQSPEFPPLPIIDFLTEPGGSQTRAQILLGKAEFDNFLQDASTLSGGWKKRLDLCRALMEEPDLLLLDEPTNHLDIEGILWLENFLKKLDTPYLVISHDRYFLEEIANKVIEINKSYPTGLLICNGSMSEFMSQKESILEAQRNKQRALSSKVRTEIDWLRTSPKARTTKSRSRIQQAYQLIDELSEVKQKNKIERVGIAFSASERETRKLLVAKNISKALGGKTLFDQLDLTLSPGTRLGIVGKNGTGKTTLLKLLARMMETDSGTVKYADNLNLVYFDQHREKIPSNVTLKEALSPNSDMVDYRGQKIHVNGWAKRFLFSPDKLNLPVNYLSGGERARILIAKLMLQPADILFLDEPTNDLDIPTLEVIEESLSSFPGAVVLISHDRCLMDRLCTSILGLQEDTPPHFVASYEQWTRYIAPKKVKPQTAPTPKVKQKTQKLSYKEKCEFESIEGKITEKEALVQSIQDKIDNEGYSQSEYQLLAETQQEVEVLYQRWQELSDKTNKII